ncbi:MAG: glycosyltransferase family 4 protein [Bacteroidaceae bacterium]|nr:glycosyltransferase family 4 protein [Bacteroidaceae bacterium]
MKILLIDNAGLVCKNHRFYCVEGTGKFAAELVELGADVTMFGQKVVMESCVSVFDIEAHGIKTAGLWRKKNKVMSYLGLYFNAIKYICKSDFVYIFYPNAFRFLAFICSLLGVKYGLYVRGDEGIEDRVSKRIYKRAAVVLTVSQMFTNMVNRVTNSNVAENIRPMLSYDDSDVVYDHVYVSKDKYELLFLCRIQKAKGILELMEALQRMKSNDAHTFHLTVAGDGDYLDEAKNECKKMGLENEVTFLGGVYDNKLKAEIYRKADLYVLPTYYNEGFPRTLYEAMIFGTPVLTTMVAGIASLMKDKENCRELAPHSVDSIVEVLTYAFNHYDEMGKLAKNGAKMVAKVVDRNRPSHARQLYQKIEQYGK